MSQPALATAATRSVIVQTADLNLGTLPGRDTLALRIRAADSRNFAAADPTAVDLR